MKNLLLAIALMLPFTANALELKFGLMDLADPLYEGVYSDDEKWIDPIDDTGLVGRIEIGHQFRFNKNFGINVFATHMSLLTEKDPHYGLHGIGAELVFTIR